MDSGLPGNGNGKADLHLHLDQLGEDEKKETKTSPLSDPNNTLALTLPPDEDDEIENMIVAGILEDGIPSPPDGGWGWVIVFASFTCNVILDACTSSFGVILPLIAADFGTGIGNVAWAGSLLCGISLLIGPIVSALVHKYDCRRVCIAGSIIASLAFLSASLFATNLPILLLTYGFFAGIGFGMIYLPCIVCVGYYFESKRALATGLSVAGSGVGAISAAPIVSWLCTFTDWRGACLLFAALCSLCSIAGALMRPLQIKLQSPEDCDLERAEVETRNSLYSKLARQRNGSQAGSEYYLVHLPDGTTERRRKISTNVDPGVLSSATNLANLDQLFGPDSIPFPTAAAVIDVLPTIAENGAHAPLQTSNSISSRDVAAELPSPARRPARERRISTESCDEELQTFRQFRPRTSTLEGVSQKGSASQFSTTIADSNISRERRNSIKLVPTPSLLSSLLMRRAESQSGSIGGGAGNGDHQSLSSPCRRDLASAASESKYLLSRNGGTLLLRKSQIFHTSKDSLSAQTRTLRPMSRKDVFYIGSIELLVEFQSQKSLNAYRQSIVDLPAALGAEKFDAKRHLWPRKLMSIFCPCFKSHVFYLTLRNLVSVSLLKNPVFLVIALSGFVAMLGFYVPIVYGIDFAVKKGIPPEKAAFLISIIGVTSIFGRIAFGFVSDIPHVNSLLINNVCILIMGICTGMMPLCEDSIHVIGTVYILFGAALSGFIVLTSIILVDLLGLQNLTSAFGLLIFFRGISSVIGPPIAGALYDSTQSYEVPFYLAGGFLIIAALISFTAPWAARYAPPNPTLEQDFEPKPTFHLEDILEGVESESEGEEEDDEFE